MAKGWKLSAETRDKMRAARLGRPIDDATRAKISATLRRRWRLIEKLEREQAHRAA
jgi:hypothetical protein